MQSYANEEKLIIPGDKTTNFYKITIEEHEKLKRAAVTKEYKIEKKRR